MRVLILAHGHPDLSAGGGERAAYSLFQRLKQEPSVTKAVFVAYAPPSAIGHDASFGSFRRRSDEILVSTPPVDGFTFQSLGYDELKRIVLELVASIKPDVVHIHHFIFWGIEIFELFKRAGVRVVMTLHEYAAICAHYGQMVKADGRLCHVASPGECGMCFPAVSAGKFFVRTTLLKSLFSHIDRFVAPSRFLKDRYVMWGLASEQVSVIENLLDASLVSQFQASSDETQGRRMHSDGKHVFGYFAQINPFKGFDLLLEAATLLPDGIRKQVVIKIHGENRHYRETDFHKRTSLLLESVRDVVFVVGGYRNEEVISLMTACDWVIVPSIWWENSPVVVQEARLAARPLVSSDLGGLAEKSDPGVDRLFPARSAGALANVIRSIVEEGAQASEKRLRELAQSRVLADDRHVADHLALYSELLGS